MFAFVAFCHAGMHPSLGQMGAIVQRCFNPAVYYRSPQHSPSLLALLVSGTIEVRRDWPALMGVFIWNVVGLVCRG